jgi:hypothetical protein
MVDIFDERREELAEGVVTGTEAGNDRRWMLVEGKVASGEAVVI